MKRLLLLAVLAACGGEPKPPAPSMVAPPIRAALVPAPRFVVGQGVKTIQAVWIRSSPFHGNTTSNVIATGPLGSAGTIMGGPVLDTSSDGDRWSRWDVAFSGTLPRGWVADTYLVATTVPPPPSVVTTVSVSPATMNLQVGATGQLIATARDQNGAIMAEQSFAWTSGSGTIAVVSSTGLVTGVAPGGAMISATDAGKTGQAAITVTPPPPPPPPTVAGIMVVPPAASIRIGDVLLFRDTVFDTNGAVMVRPVVWSSGNGLVATIDTGGIVSAVSVGSTLLTATIGTVHASAALTVMARRPLPFDGIYAKIGLRNGRLQIARRDSAGYPPIRVSVGDSVTNGFYVRDSTAALYAIALRQLARDLASRADTIRFGTANALSVDSVFCAALGCWVTTTSPSPWTSSPPIGAASLVGLARALEAAVRGDSVFAPGDSLPYIRTVP